jgi:uncharacterized protein (TIGR02246 family)
MVPTSEEIMALSELWLDTVKTHDPSAVTELYAPYGVLVGTVAQRIKQGHEDIEGYFDMFLAKDGLTGTYQSHLIQTFNNWAIDSGTYTFEWVEEGKSVIVPARFTFVYEKSDYDRGWRIANHHSSELPL